MKRAVVLVAALAAARTAAAQQAVDLPAELSLDAALQIGRANQPQLRRARAQSAAADARVDEARAPLLPQITANAGYTRATGNFVPRAGSGITAMTSTSFDTYNFFTSGVSASQLVWDFGQAWRRRDAARANADAQLETERATRLAADFTIRTAFFTARASRDAVAVAKEALENQSRHVEQIKAFVEVGTRPEIDLLQARTDEANAEVQLIDAENGYATARAVLNQAMGVEAPAAYAIVGAPSQAMEGEAGALEPLVDEAVRARPDVVAGTAQLRAQELTNRATAGRYGPTLLAGAGLTYAGRELDNLVWNVSGGLTLSWPLLEGGLVRATEREGDANRTALAAQVDVLRQQARVEVDGARLAIAAGKAELSAAERSLHNAKARLELAELRYRTGVGNGIELSDAQLAATRAGFQRLQSALKLDTARAQLQRALGRQ